MRKREGVSGSPKPFLRPAALLGAILMAMMVPGCLFESKGPLDHPSVCGNVYDGGNEEPIVDAIVHVHFCFELGSIAGDHLEVKTDASGYFHLASGNCMGKFGYEITISKAGYDSLYEISSQRTTGFLKDCVDHDYYLDKKAR